jgi:hypothetical protein
MGPKIYRERLHHLVGQGLTDAAIHGFGIQIAVEELGHDHVIAINGAGNAGGDFLA